MIKDYNNFKKVLEATKPEVDETSEEVDPSELDRKSYTKIKRCFLQVVNCFGFFSDLLYKLRIAEANPGDGIDTMATDGVSIIYNKDFVNRLSEEEVVFVLIHEVMHNANFHFARQGGRDHELWNWAADYAINLQINDLSKERGSNILKAPAKILLDEKYRGLTAEQIYALLEKEKKPGGDGDSGAGGGGGKPGKPGQGQGQGQGQGSGLPQPGDGTPQNDVRKAGSLSGKGKTVQQGASQLSDAKSDEALEKAWGTFKNNAASSNRGTGSASTDRWIAEINKPKIDWRQELRKFVKYSLDKADFAPWNKKYIYRGIYDYTLKNVIPSSFDRVILAIDTSGSIDDETLNKFATEIKTIIKSYDFIKEIDVIWCDSKIPKDGVQEFKNIKKGFNIPLKPKGGGGTDFNPPFEWVQKNLIKKGKQPAFMIYFTDAFSESPRKDNWQINRYDKRVLWVITGNPGAGNHLTFGKKLYLDKDKK